MSTGARYIPDRFRRAVTTHLASALMGGEYGASQIMVIVGPPGGGKTHNLLACLDYLGVTACHFDAGMVESHQANRPLELLQATAVSVRTEIEQARPAALVMDDADLLLGRYDGVQYTHNLQHVTQHLMSLATGRDRYGAVMSPCPVFFCVNDPSILHAPLIRVGRARVFEWEPDGAEKLGMFLALFQGVSEGDAAKVVDEFRDESPAFFGRLRQVLFEEYLAARASKAGDHAVLLEALAVSNGMTNPPLVTVAQAELVALGRRIKHERSVVDDSFIGQLPDRAGELEGDGS